MTNKIPGVHSDPDILGGAPVFVGTRVPVRALLDYLEHGRPLAEFLDDFPTVERRLAVGVLEHMKQLVTSCAFFSMSAFRSGSNGRVGSQART